MTCKGCGNDVDPLAVFPGGLCVVCFERSEDVRMPTAAEVVALWGGVVR